MVSKPCSASEVTCLGSRFFVHLPRTLIDLNSSMSPIRGDVKKKISPVPLRERRMEACIQPSLSSGEAVGSPRIPDRPSSFAVCTRRFHDAKVIRRLRFWKLTQADALALVGQPWSYLRLEAYSFFGLCEGAYGAFGGSVLDDSTRGLTHRLILSLDPERRKNRLANRRVSKTWACLVPVDAQAACDFRCSASKRSPFFQSVNVMAAILRASVRRAISGFIPLASSLA